MKKTFIAALFITVLMCSCHQQKQEVISDDLPTPEQMVKPYFADNYPVTDKMFGKATSSRPVKTEHLESQNTAWFTNDSLKQTLSFILFSDNERLVTSCFDNDNVPNEVIEKMDLNDAQMYTASAEDKLVYFKEFFKKAKKIETKYFTSNKGFKIGDPKEKAIKQYGKPDSVKTVEGFEKYYWNPVGAQVSKQPAVDEKDLLLIDEKKQFITMYFKNNKLATIIFDNVNRPRD